MTVYDKMYKCKQFFNKLSKILEETYEVIGSCNNDETLYLIPWSSSDDLSYYGKPDRSFRFSDHWNWYSNIRKCKIEEYVQCESVDLPVARIRPEAGKASKPRMASQVAFYDSDGKYHWVFGDKYDRATNSWSFIETDPNKVAKELGLI